MPDMDFYAPFDTGPGSAVTTEVWRSFMRRMVISGVVRDAGENLEVYADSTGMQVKIKPGEVLIEGHWARNTTEKVLSVPSAHPSLPRRDLVVARVNMATKTVEYAIKTGTPGPPTGIAVPQQDSVIWEVVLACIRVPAGAVTISPSNVEYMPQWGGVIAPTTMDDWLMHEDKVSTVARGMVNQDVAVAQNTGYFFRMRTQKEVKVSRLRCYVCNRLTAGTIFTRVFYGPHITMLNNWFDCNSWSPALSSDGLSECTFSPITLPPNTEIAIFVRGNGSVAGASPANSFYYAGTSPTEYLQTGGGTAASFALNPNTTWTQGATAVSGFKSTTSTPTSLNLLDGSWSRRDRIAWFALAGDLG